MPVSSLPSGLLENYYQVNKDQLRVPYEEFAKNAFENLDRDDVEAMGDFVHSHFSDYDREQFDQEIGLTEWRDSQPGWIENVARGMGERGANLLGGLTEVAAIGLRELGAEDSDIENTVSSFAESMRDADFGYEEWTSWEDVKEAPLSNVFAFAMEQGLISAPDMAAVLVNLPTYVAARTGELAADRAQADNYKEARGVDFLAALPTATASALMERIGARGILGLAKKKPKTAGESVLEQAGANLPKKGGLKGWTKEIIRAGAKEMATEAGQEAIEYTGTHAGTETGFDPAQAGEAALIGGTVGAVFGGTVRGVTGGAQIMQGKTQENLQATIQEAEEANAARSQDSYDLEEEANQGVRQDVPFSNLAEGEEVIVSPWEGESIRGTVQYDQENQRVDILDPETGSPVMSWGMDDVPESGTRPTRFYQASQDEVEGEPIDDKEAAEVDDLTRYSNELERVMGRAGNAEDMSEAMASAYSKIRNDKRFEKLPDDVKNQIDDILEQREAVKAAEEAKKQAEKAGAGAAPTAEEPLIDQTAKATEDFVSKVDKAAESPEEVQTLFEDPKTVEEMRNVMGEEATNEVSDLVKRMQDLTKEEEKAQVKAEETTKAAEEAEHETDKAMVLYDQKKKKTDDIAKAEARQRSMAAKSNAKKRKRLAAFEAKEAQKDVKLLENDKKARQEEAKAAQAEVEKLTKEKAEVAKEAVNRVKERAKPFVAQEPAPAPKKKTEKALKATDKPVKSTDSKTKTPAPKAKAATKPPPKKEVQPQYTPEEQAELKKKARQKDPDTGITYGKSTKRYDKKLDEVEGKASEADFEIKSTADRDAQRVLNKFDDEYFKVAGQQAMTGTADVDAKVSKRKLNSLAKQLRQFKDPKVYDQLSPEMQDVVDNAIERHEGGATPEFPLDPDQITVSKRSLGEETAEELAEIDEDVEYEEEAPTGERVAYGTTLDAPAVKPKTMREKGHIPFDVEDDVAELESAISEDRYDRSVEATWKDFQAKIITLTGEEQDAVADVSKKFTEHKKKFIRKRPRRKVKLSPEAQRQEETKAIIGDGKNVKVASELLHAYYSNVKGGPSKALDMEIKALQNMTQNNSVDTDVFLYTKDSLNGAINENIKNKSSKNYLDTAAIATNLRLSRDYIENALLETSGMSRVEGMMYMREKMADVMGPDKSTVASRKTIKGMMIKGAQLPPIKEDTRIFKDMLGTDPAFTDPFYRPPYTKQNPEAARKMVEAYNDTYMNPDKYLGEDVLVDYDQVVAQSATVDHNIADEAEELLFFRVGDETDTNDDGDTFDLNSVANLPMARVRDLHKAHDVLARMVKHYIAMNKAGQLTDIRQKEMATKFASMLRAVDKELKKRASYSLPEKLNDQYAIELKAVQEVVNGETVTKFRINNRMVHGKRMDEEGHLQLRGVAETLTDFFGRENLKEDQHIFEWFGGVKGYDKNVKSRSKVTWTFEEDIFQHPSVQEALNLDRGRKSVKEVLDNELGGVEEGVIRNYEAGDIAPKLTSKEKPNKAVQTFINRGRGKIEDVVLDNQIEDIGRIAKAMREGKRGFMIGTPPGSGKTFMLGGAIKQMMDENPKLNFVYVTKKTDLHAQIKKDLNPVLKKELAKGEATIGTPPVAGTVRPMTYQKLTNIISQDAHQDKLQGSTPPDLQNWVDENTVIIYDESHEMANVEGAYNHNFYQFSKNAKFNVFASGTPFNNPQHAQYMRWGGIFDSFGKTGQEGYYNLLRSVGGTVRDDPKALAQRMQSQFTSDPNHPSVAPSVSWDPDNEEDRKAQSLKFMEALVKSGQYMTRPVYIDRSLIEHEFESVDVHAKYLQATSKLNEVYDFAAQFSEQFGFTKFNLYGHKSGLEDTLSETAKVEEAANKVVMEAYHPSRIVKTSGGKSPSMRMQAILDANKNGDAIRWRNLIFSKVDTNPGENLTEGTTLGWRANRFGGRFMGQVKDGKLRQKVWLNKDEWVEVEIAPRKVINFIERKNDRWIGRFKISEDFNKKPGDYVDFNEDGTLKSAKAKQADIKAQKDYTVQEVLDYYEWYKGKGEHYGVSKQDGQARIDFGKSKFQPQQIALAIAHKETGTQEMLLPSMKTAMHDALVARGMDSNKIGFYTGDETNTPESQKAKKSFNSNRKDGLQVLIVTVSAGGTGLSLHDTSESGKFPRSIVGVGLGWMANNHAQAEYRIVRQGMTSKARIKWLIAPSLGIEYAKGERLQTRLADQGYATQGNVSGAQGGIKGMLSNLIQPVGYETFPDEDAHGMIADISDAFTEDEASMRIDPEEAQVIRQLYGSEMDRRKTRDNTVSPWEQAQVKEIAKRMMPGVALDMRQWVAEPGKGFMKARPIAGYYRPQRQDGKVIGKGIIKIAKNFGPGMDAKPVNMINTVGHESIHYFRQAGLLTNKEWAALVREVKNTGALAKYNIKARYPDSSMDAQIEEAVAEMFGDYVAKTVEERRSSTGNVIQRAFNRIVQFFKRLAEALGAQPDAADVHKRMYEGEVGSRRPNFGAAAGAQSLSVQPLSHKESERRRRLNNRMANKGLTQDQKYEKAINRAKSELPLTPELENMVLNVDAAFRDAQQAYARMERRKGKTGRTGGDRASVPMDKFVSKENRPYTASELVNDWIGMKKRQERDNGRGKVDLGVLHQDMQDRAVERMKQNRQAFMEIREKSGMDKEFGGERALMNTTRNLIKRMFPNVKVSVSMDGHHFQFPVGVLRVKDHPYRYGRQFGYTKPKWEVVYNLDSAGNEVYKKRTAVQVYNALVDIHNEMARNGHNFEERFNKQTFSAAAPRAWTADENPDVFEFDEDTAPDFQDTGNIDDKLFDLIEMMLDSQTAGMNFVEQVQAAYSNPSPEFVSKVEAIHKKIMPNAKIKPVRHMEDVGQQYEYGFFDQAITDGQFDHVIAVAEDIYGSGDIVDTEHEWTVAHEAVHYFRQTGLLTDAEWKVLSEYAVESGMLSRYDINSRYNGMTEEQLIEEAVADMFGEYYVAREASQMNLFNDVIRKAFGRLKAFLKEIHGATNPNGDLTVSQVLDSMYSGEVGARQPDPDIQQREFERWSDGVSYRKAPNEAYVKFDSAETESRWKQAQKGVERVTFWEKLMTNLNEFKNKTSRHFEFIDISKKNGAFNAEIVQKLLNYEAARTNAIDEVDRFFRDVTKLVKTDKEYDLFSRAIFLKDLKWTAEKGMDIPFGLNLESVTAELAKVEAEIPKHRRVQEALVIRARKLDEMRTRMLKAGALNPEDAMNTDYIRHQVLEYAQGKYNAGGRKLHTPTKYRRLGSEMDINANYFEAESEWMFKALTDIATLDLGNWLRKSKYNSAPRFTQMAREQNDARAHDVLKADILNGIDEMMKQEPPSKVAPKKYKADLKRLRDAIEGLDTGNPVALAQVFERELSSIVGADLRKAGVDTFQFLNELSKVRYSMSSKFGQISGLVKRMSDPNAPPSQRALWESMPADIKRSANLIAKVEGEAIEGDPDLLKIASWFSKQNDKMWRGHRDTALGLFATIQSKHTLYKQMLGNDYVDPKNMAQLAKEFGSKDDQTLWQMASKNGERAVNVFSAYTIPEHIYERTADNILEAISEVIGDVNQGGAGGTVDVPLDDIRRMMGNMRKDTVVGGPKEQMILPADIAVQLNNLQDPHTERMLGDMMATGQRYWKIWILMSPRRVVKYVINNITGDLDAILANPSAYGTFSELKRASKEIREWQKGEKPSAEFMEALRMGVVGSTLSAQEIPSSAIYELERTGALEFDVRKYSQGNIIKKGVRNWFQLASTAVQWREATVRYAAYLNYRKKIVDQKMTPKEFGYGATPPWMIEGVTNKHELAAMMARDALGDYGNISKTGRMLRTKAIPFWSWMESNTKRYFNLFRNIYHFPADTEGRTLAGAAVAASLLMRMGIFYAAVQLWNNMFFGDDEEQLGAEERIRMHLNLGQLWGDDDTRYTLRMQGALSDVLGWAGAEDVGATIHDVETGRASPKDVLTALVQAPFNKLAQSLSPAYKLPLEVSLGIRMFPDVFNPGDIIDSWDHALRSFALENEYAAIASAAGLPVSMKGEGDIVSRYMQSWVGAVLYNKTVGEADYNWVRSDVRNWKTEQTDPDEKRRLSRLLTQAQKRKDTQAVERIKGMMKEKYGYGRTTDQRRGRSQHPLYGLSKAQQREYINNLPASERSKVRNAIKYQQDL